MKLNKVALCLQAMFGIALLSPSFSVNAQEGKVELEQKPIPELPDSISGSETVRSRMDKFIREQGLREVKDNKKDESGRAVLIDFATATISATASDPNLVNARIFAFNKAMLNAKAQCAEFQKTVVATEAVLDATLPPADRARADAEQLRREGLTQEGAAKVAEALNQDVSGKANMPQVVKTAALYGEKLLGMKMAEELRKKGLDPSKPVEKQAALAVAESQSFKNAVSTVAAARCTGIKAMASFEQNPSSGQGQVGIVTVWSEKLHAIADAIVTNQWDLIQRGEPGKKISDHIPDKKSTLITTYGAQLVRDEKGDYVVLAYSQAQPRSKNQQSIDSAYEAAKTSAMGLIRSFMGEAVETNRQLLNAETSTVFVDESTRYQEESSFQRSVRAFGDKLPISGMTQAYEWETLHPANNAPVVGVVMQWKVDSAKIAGFLSSLNHASGEKAKAASAGAYGSGDSRSAATANSNAPKNASVPQKKVEAYSGQGSSSRDF
jgi:hypothetical protein